MELTHLDLEASIYLPDTDEFDMIQVINIYVSEVLKSTTELYMRPTTR